MWLLEWPFLKRNWAGDKIYLENKLKGYGTTNNELTMVIFPEGTRWTVKKHADAVKYANERKLHVPVHTMIPRYKGFQALVRGLGKCSSEGERTSHNGSTVVDISSQRQ